MSSLPHVFSSGHDCCETVRVQLCASKDGLPVFVVAEQDFRFVQDEAYDAAQFLAASAGNQQALNFTRFLDRSGPPSGDVNSLDEKVALAFRHLKLPAEWNVLGTDQTSHGKNLNTPRTQTHLGRLRVLMAAASLQSLPSSLPQRLDASCSCGLEGVSSPSFSGAGKPVAEKCPERAGALLWLFSVPIYSRGGMRVTLLRVWGPCVFCVEKVTHPSQGP